MLTHSLCSLSVAMWCWGFVSSGMLLLATYCNSYCNIFLCILCAVRGRSCPACLVLWCLMLLKLWSFELEQGVR